MHFSKREHMLAQASTIVDEDTDLLIITCVTAEAAAAMRALAARASSMQARPGRGIKIPGNSSSLMINSKPAFDGLILKRGAHRA